MKLKYKETTDKNQNIFNVLMEFIHNLSVTCLYFVFIFYFV